MSEQKCNGKVLDHSDGYEYEEECPKCKKLHFTYTQRDEYPEYYTSVGVKCDCGEVVWFSLPVN